MEHDEAMRLHAAERYVARELSPEEKDAFEEHYFDCPTCAEEVRLEMTFAANLRAALSEPLPAPSLWRKWREWFQTHPALAFSFAGNLAWAAAFAFILLPGARDVPRPQFVPAYFAPGSARGADDVHEVPRGNAYYQVRFLPSPNSPSYSYEIANADGQRESSGSLPPPASQEEYLYLQVPVKSLPGGIHILEVHAGQAGGETVSRSKFQTSR
jgi:hypothetical protein